MGILDYKEYVCAVCEEKSFSRAARRLFVSQPWLSSAVKKTEQEIGTALFDRTTSPISLTEAGMYYLEQARRVMEIEEKMRRHFEQAGQEERLNLGSSMFFCSEVFPSLLRGFREEYPGVAMTFTEGDSVALSEKLLQGTLDFVLEAEEIHDPRIQSVAWAPEEIVLAVPASYPINERLAAHGYRADEFLKRNEPGGKKPPVLLKEFRDLPFLMLQKGNEIYGRGMRMCRRAGFVPEVAMYLTQMVTAYALVCEGQGVSFLRSTIAGYARPGKMAVFYQLEDPETLRNLYLSYRKEEFTPVQKRMFAWLQENRPGSGNSIPIPEGK